MAVKTPNIVAIIQARVSSRRLPGKVLKTILNKTVIEHVFNRTSFSRNVNQVVVATSTDSSDDILVNHCLIKKIPVFRGPLNDVLKRFAICANNFNATHIVRITGDCPLIDPLILDKIIYEGIKGEYDCFGLGEPFPDGLDCTILSYKSLKEADQKATLLSDREHVCPFIERENNVFKCGSLQLFESHNEKRWTLDEEADLELITEIYKNLYHDEKMFFTEDILRLLKKKPALEKINNHIIRNEGYLHSLNKDQDYER